MHRLRLATVIAAAAALAAPGVASATHRDDGDDNASCVAQFVVPQAQEGQYGQTVRTFPEIFHPLGQSVSFHARSPRVTCPFQAP